MPGIEAPSAESEPAVAEVLAQVKQHIQSARFDPAETLLRGLEKRQLQADQELETLYMLAVVRRYRQDPAAALRTVGRLIDLSPHYARAYQEKGYNLLSLNQPADAMAAFQQAVDLNPGLVASWKALMNLHDQTGDAGRARLARSQVEYLSGLPQELAGVIDLMHEGKLYKAETLCRNYLQRHKHHVEAMRLLADIGMRLRVYDDAEFLLESCVEFEPDNLRARSDYLQILNRKSKFEKAYEQAEILCRMQPGNPVFQLSRANALTGIGCFAEGMEQYRVCLANSPGEAGIHVLLGHARKAVGQTAEAVASYKEAYRLRPDYGDAFWSLANTKTYRFTDEEIQHMRDYEAKTGIHVDDRVHFCFAAGKAYEDRGEYRESFAYYRRGNDLKREKSGYRAEKTSEMVQAQIDVCTRDLFAQRGHLGFPAPDPVFIVGLPRSGSTLLEQILASHSMIDGTLELHDILGLAQRLRGRSAQAAARYPQILWELEDRYFSRFGEQFIDNTRVYRGKAPLFIDKMPNNFMHIGLIRLILPRAKIIDARREPMACCFSNFKQLFGEGQDFTYGLEEIGRYYCDYVRLMQHWDEVLPGHVLHVQYEDVVADLESQVARILDFLDLPCETACLEFHRTDRVIRTPSAEQVRQPINTRGLEQWKPFEPWLGPLKQALAGG